MRPPAADRRCGRCGCCPCSSNRRISRTPCGPAARARRICRDRRRPGAARTCRRPPSPPWRHHHPRAIRELRDQWRIGRLQNQLDGERIDDIDMVDRCQFRLSERARECQMPLQRKLCSFRSEGLAVVKLDTGPKLDGDFLAVGRRLVAQRELRHDIELFVDVEQLVAERCEHDAAHIGARHGRIEDIRILGEPDAKRRLGLERLPEATAAEPPPLLPYARFSSLPSPCLRLN